MKPIRITIVTLIIFVILTLFFAILIKPAESLEFHEIMSKYGEFLPGNTVPKDFSCRIDYPFYDAWYCSREDKDALLFVYLNQGKISYTHLYLKNGISLGELKRFFGAWERRTRTGRNTYWTWEEARAYVYGNPRTTLFTKIRSITFS